MIVSFLHEITAREMITCEVDFVTNKGAKPESLKMCSVEKSQTISSLRVTFANIDDSVKALNFIGNQKISYLPVNVDVNFPNLLFYVVSHCSIQKVAKINFAKLKELIGLSINENQIDKIDADTFEDLISLQYLSLSMKIRKLFKNLVKTQSFSCRSQ